MRPVEPASISSTLTAPLTYKGSLPISPKTNPTFRKVAKKAGALDIITGAAKEFARGQVKEAVKQIYELGKDLGPVIVQTAAYAFFRNMMQGGTGG